MYKEYNLEGLPKVKAIVVRGFITRYHPQSQWETELVALPDGAVAQDADAIPHYIKGVDGLFYEYYGWEPSTEAEPIFIEVD